MDVDQIQICQILKSVGTNEFLKSPIRTLTPSITKSQDEFGDAFCIFVVLSNLLWYNAKKVMG